MEKKDVIKKLKNLLDELAAEEDPEEMTTEIALPTPPHPRWKPKLDEKCYYIENTGYINVTSYNLNTVSRQEIGNAFKSLEDAEFASERLKVIAAMREWAGKWEDDFVIAYSGENNEIGVMELPYPHATYGIMRFASRKDAINCIKAVGEERLKKYYFMIPEEEA